MFLEELESSAYEVMGRDFNGERRVLLSGKAISAIVNPLWFGPSEYEVMGSSIICQDSTNTEEN